jgi:anti-anti-sigma factor
MNVEIEITAIDHIVTIVMKGTVNIYNLNYVKEKILSILDSAKQIIFQLDGIDEFDSSAAQFFISLKKYCDKNSIKLSLKDHSHTVIQILDAYGLIGFFGDKVRISASDKKNFSFKYGMKRVPISLR